MKIMVMGTRGIPHIPGGVETHCEHLYPRMIKGGANSITVICRSNYVIDKSLREYHGIKLKNIYSPKSKSFEAIVHSTLAVLHAAAKRPDVLHIHAIGPNLVAGLARLLGLKVVMTHHGPDYKRMKWNGIAKFFLKTGELMGVKFSKKVIVISQEIKDHVAATYGRNDCVLIPNGVDRPMINDNTDYIESLDLIKGQYIFTLGRFVPEKGFDYMIRAYAKSAISKKYKLVIAGDADHESEYSLELKALARKNNIVLTGFIKGEKLQQLFSHAALFIIPSFYEGLPIALLEAMSYRLPILSSNIPANTQVNLPGENYFEVGNETSLLSHLDNISFTENQRIDYDMRRYDWNLIADETLEVYKSIL
ncbi:glycosyltransferase family 4 protein [Mucilaginibacter sp. BT774]|uniref:glycosyltransferase family 4 protein n=1 Tax=Mucilaginibacter sp. BT774 TaxID=3062276 RepID=UPI0026755453|nr:glycosyltransferase family 4 protein [Mucilaginibacter sp. BT774]MDO3625436.1 glycosyltransferase family 4 protein [Mucilaginibacter sp. BT774]